LDVVGRTFIGPTISVASASLHILGNTSSSLSSSLLIQNINRSASLSVLDNGNVGIGTATPNARLDVSGSVIITGSFSSFTTGSSGFVSIVSGSQPSNDIAFNFRKIGETAGSRHTMIVQGSGGNDNNLYFGVNTVGSSPGAIFAVKGNGSVNINMPSPTGNYGGLAVGGWNSSYPSLLVRGIGATSSTTTLLVENSNTSASLVVLDNGNVGIGTTNPTYKLDISTTGNTDGVVQRLFGDADYGATTSYSRGAFYKWDVGVGASATNNIPYSNFGIVEGTTLRFVIGVGGNVGIGTSTPNAKLDVSGSAIITGSLTVTQGITGSLFGTSSFASTASFLNTLNQDLTFNGNLTLNGTASIGTLVVNQTVLSTGSNQLGDAANDTQTLFGSVIIPTGSFTVTGSLNANNTLFVSGSNVGIGTTSPTASLDIQKNSATAVRIGDAGSYPILFNFNTQTGDLSTFSRIRSLSSQPIILSPMGTDAVTINTSGNVGIGTTSPTSKLEVRGSGATSSTTALRIENSNATASFIVRDDSDVFIGNNSTSGILYLPRDPSFGDRVLVRLQNSNNITLLGVVSQDTLYTNMGFIVNNTTTLNGNIQGINYTGTGSVYRFVSEMNSYEGTGNLIHVSAQIRNQSNGISNIIAITSPFVTDSPGQIIRGFYYNPSISGMASVADNRAIETTSGNILFQSGSSPLFFVSQSGNVGIGTINPASRLDVQGDINIGVSGATTVSTYYNSTTRNQIIYTNNSSFEFIEGANERMRLVAGSGNLLVGTTSNLARLQVRGAGATSSTTALRIENSNASSSLVVLDNGSVGIRTATPGAALEVNGDTIFQSTGVGDGTLAMTIKNSSGTQTLAIGAAGGIIMNTSTKIKTTIGDSSITPYIELYSNSTGNTTIQSSTSYGLVLNPAGANVGIGTITPTQKLDINGALVVGMTTPAPFWNAKFKDYNDGSGIYISAINGGGGKYIAGNSYYYNSTQWWSDKTVASAINLDNGTLVFYTDSGLTPNTDYIPSERMRISSAGNLLVGTTSNLARLHVRGSGATSSTTTLRVENSSATPSMVVLDDGFVGINSTSVYQDSNDKLVITGGRLSINASSYNATFFNRSDSGLISEFGTGGFGRGGLSFDGTDFTLYSRSGLKIQHSTNSTAVTINTSGSVGIGTTTPTSRLQSNNLSTYNNSIPNGAIIASNLAGGNAIIDIGVDSTSLGYIQSRHIANTTVYNLLLNPMGGNVGIGTINPASRLDVQGDINIGVSGATTVSTYYNSTTRNQIIYTNNSSFEFIEGANERMRLVAGSGNLLVGTTSNLARLQVRGSGATSSTTALRIENSNASSSLVVLDNGNVGIGTTSPLSKLNIASDSNLVFTLSNIDNAIAGSSGSPLSRTISFLGYNDNQNAFIRSDDMAASFVHSNLIFGVKQSGTSATEFMRIDGQFGNVGIGTTSPNAKLHISGTLLVDNSLLINKTSSSLASGTRTLDSALTGSYSSAFYNYTISSGSNARAGQFMVVWNGGSVQYTDVSTLDIGNTSAIALTASLSGANLNVTAILPSDLWTIKTLANFL
jgi:hypothetical protein